MPRSHYIEETIEDRIPRAMLVHFLQEKGLIPNEWSACSVHVTQESAGDEIVFVSKRSYPAPKPTKRSCRTSHEKRAARYRAAQS